MYIRQEMRCVYVASHDGVQAGRPVGSPGGECVFGGFGYVADVDAMVIEIEVERLRFAFAEGE